MIRQIQRLSNVHWLSGKARPYESSRIRTCAPRVERYHISFGKGRDRCLALPLTTSPSVIGFSGGKELPRQPLIWGGQAASILVRMSKMDEKYQTGGIFGLVPESFSVLKRLRTRSTSSSRSKRV